MNHCTNSCLTPLIQHSIFRPHSSSLPFQPHWSFISWKTTSSWPPWGLRNGHLRLAVTSLFLQRAAASSLWGVLNATSSEIFLVTWSTHPNRPPNIQRPILHFLVDLTISTILSLQILFTSNKMQVPKGQGTLSELFFAWHIAGAQQILFQGIKRMGARHCATSEFSKHVGVPALRQRKFSWGNKQTISKQWNKWAL